MTAFSILIALGALALTIAIPVGMARRTRREYDELRRVVSASDEVMQKAALILGLQFLPGGNSVHPTIGAISSFGTVRGFIDGVRIVASVESADDGNAARLVLSTHLTTTARHPALSASRASRRRFHLEQSGQTLVLRPQLTKWGSAQFIVYELATDPRELVALLREFARIVNEGTLGG